LPTILIFDLVQYKALNIGIFVFFYYIPAIVALRYLWRKMKEPGGADV